MQPVAEKRSAVWGVAGSACAGLVMYLTSAAGVALGGYAGALQVGFLVGAVVGVVAPSWRSALVAAVIALALGVFLLPPWFDVQEPLTLVVLVVAALAFSAGVRVALDSGQARPGLVVGFALVVAVACMLLVALSIVNVPNPHDGGLTMLQRLDQRPALGQTWSDSQFYEVVVWKMRGGMPYLEAFRSAYHENPSWRIDPFSIFAVRPPLLFYFWKSLPNPWTRSALWSLLALVCMAMAAAPVIARRSVPAIVGVAGATALAGYVLGFALKPGLLFMFEIWTGVLAVLIVAAYAQAMRPEGGRGWMIASACLALAAALVRELLLFALLAGLIASWFGPKEKRRFDVTVWVAACGGFLLYWAVQAQADRSIVTAAKPISSVWLAHGGFANLVSGIYSSTWAIGGSWMSIVLVVLGIAGAAAQPNRQFRVFALAAVLMPLVGFLFVGTNAVTSGTGQPYNYWGAIVLPLLYVLAPTALAWIPGMRPSRAPEPVPPDVALPSQPSGAPA